MLEKSLVISEAKTLFLNKKYKKSFLKLIKYSNELSHDVQYLELLADLQYAMGYLSEYLKTLKVILKYNHSFETQKNIISVSLKLGYRQDCLDFIIQCLPKTQNKDQTLYFLNALCEIHFNHKDFAALKDTLEKIQYIGCQDADYFYYLSAVDQHEYNMDSAIERMRASIALNPESDLAWTSLALLHYKIGDKELALANLRRALDINPANTVALKYQSHWINFNNITDITETLQKIEYAMKDHDFNETLLKCKINLLNNLGFNDSAEFESQKLNLYFGNVN